MRISAFDQWRRLARRFGRHNRQALILMYHRVAEEASDPWSLCVAPEHFAGHLQVLRKFARPVKLQDVVHSLSNGREPAPWSVTVTFDDGYSDNLYCAKPLLERYDVPATVFLATGYLGSDREYWWDALERLFLHPGSLPPALRLQLNGTSGTWELGGSAHYGGAAFQTHRGWKAEQDPPTPRQDLYRSVWQAMQRMPETGQQRVLAELMTWASAVPECRQGYRPMTPEEVVDLARGGLIEPGAHTVTHPVLSSLPAARQREEIQGSKARVEEIVGYPISSFAYPYGDYSEESIAILQENRFAVACSTAPGAVQKGADPLRLPRIHVGNWSGEEFERRLSAWFEK